MLDEQELMQEMWQKWQPYNRANDDRWRSYVVGKNDAETLGLDDGCVTLCKANDGTLYAM